MSPQKPTLSNFLNFNSVKKIIFDFAKLSNGFTTCIRYIFKRKLTVNFPYEKNHFSPNFKGDLALRRYENGEERCISCKLCEVVCPAQAITVGINNKNELIGQDESQSTSPSFFEIDRMKCVSCGLCEQACPVDAIGITPTYEFSTLNFQDLIYNKSKLLDNGDKWEPYFQQKANKRLNEDLTSK